MRDRARRLDRQLKAEYDDESSDSVVDEAIQANEWPFTANGTFFAGLRTRAATNPLTNELKRTRPARAGLDRRRPGSSGPRGRRPGARGNEPAKEILAV